MTSESIPIFDFTLTPEQKNLLKNWQIVGDNVMGGISTGTFEINKQGKGVFQGEVSLANNGGFSLVRYRFQEIKLMSTQKVVLKIKGDGKKYQFRIKSNSSDKYSYITNFLTTGEWQRIEIPFYSMQAKYRGRALDIPNFNRNHLSEIGFLIGNKKAEKFKLQIESVYAE